MARERVQIGPLWVVATDWGRFLYIENGDGDLVCEVDCEPNSASMHADLKVAWEWAVGQNLERARMEEEESMRARQQELDEWEYHYQRSRGRFT